MYYSRKKLAADVPLEMTAVWMCTREGCNGWMRDDFAFTDDPACGQCQSPMVRSTKMLPLLVNTDPFRKSLKSRK